ncbi:rab family GTP-binding protein [Reticulomyxa filosa]|uniref:Rab family GTP-binding protein n=1 Tax=Reticulomyxa filosa TaxID=46433 RepID=X6NSK5_RETFI|nr:rab family GTP-binding protein [Reticulomyxa filosa]|eukprot:ETO29275.1 rab family GTP-binding protein [Reticulomyxa filosa]
MGNYTGRRNKSLTTNNSADNNVLIKTKYVFPNHVCSSQYIKREIPKIVENWTRNHKVKGTMPLELIAMIASFLPIEDDKYNFSLQCALKGDSSVGKSSIIHRFVENIFHHTYLSTIGTEFWIKKVDIGTTRVKLLIFDIAGIFLLQICPTRIIIKTKHKKGKERFSLRQAHKTDICLVVYDVTFYDSFSSVASWIKHENDLGKSTAPTIVVIGNKSDKSQSERQVNEEEVKEFCESFNQPTVLFGGEVSALSGIGVSDAILLSVRQHLSRFPQCQNCGMHIKNT